MASVALNFRIPDDLLQRMRRLRGYVARTADVPCAPDDLTMSDIARRALAAGVEVIERSRDMDKAAGLYRDA